jgi:hypothetical protein
MANIITAGNSTNGGTQIVTDTSGTLNIVTGSGSGSNAITIDSSQNVSIPKGVGGTPAFSAYQSTGQSLSVGVGTKVLFQTEEFDTASCFNNTGSTVGGIPAYAFLPNVAGYYQINVNVRFATYAGNNFTILYKNGSQERYIIQMFPGMVGGGGSALIYMNGTTDYLEIYMVDGVGGTTSPLLKSTYFQAFLARGV